MKPAQTSTATAIRAVPPIRTRERTLRALGSHAITVSVVSADGLNAPAPLPPRPDEHPGVEQAQVKDRQVGVVIVLVDGYEPAFTESLQHRSATLLAACALLAVSLDSRPQGAPFAIVTGNRTPSGRRGRTRLVGLVGVPRQLDLNRHCGSGHDPRRPGCNEPAPEPHQPDRGGPQCAHAPHQNGAPRPRARPHAATGSTSRANKFSRACVRVWPSGHASACLTGLLGPEHLGHRAQVVVRALDQLVEVAGVEPEPVAVEALVDAHLAQHHLFEIVATLGAAHEVQLAQPLLLGLGPVAGLLARQPPLELGLARKHFLERFAHGLSPGGGLVDSDDDGGAGGAGFSSLGSPFSNTFSGESEPDPLAGGAGGGGGGGGGGGDAAGLGAPGLLSSRAVSSRIARCAMPTFSPRPPMARYFR